LTQLIENIYNQIEVVHSGNVFLWTDAGVGQGIRVRGFSFADMMVTLTITPAVPGVKKPDYRGWEIVPSELTGRGILVRDQIDYTWNKDTAKFTLLQPGDVFQAGNFYNIHFNSITDPKGNSYPTISDFGINLITATTTIDASYFGKKLVIEPASPFITITLPAISTIVQGRPLMVEVGGVGLYTVKIVSPDATINWMRNAIYMMAGESLTIYKYMRGTTPELRVCAADGNFHNVGLIVSSDDVVTGVRNMLLLDGSTKNKNQFARLYNEFVLHLPLTQVMAFGDWSVGNNNKYFSLSNASDLFHVPDRRGLYERANSASSKAGDYLDESIRVLPDVKGVKVVPGGRNTIGGHPDAIDIANPTGKEFSLLEGFDIVAPGASETRPKSYLINKYVIC
jgi:hypothetical protein